MSILTDSEANMVWFFNPNNHCGRYGEDGRKSLLSDKEICLLEEQDRITRAEVSKKYEEKIAELQRQIDNIEMQWRMEVQSFIRLRDDI